MADEGYSVFDALFELTREYERAFIRIEKLAVELPSYEEMSRPELFKSVLHGEPLYEHLLNEERESTEFRLRSFIGMLISKRLATLREQLEAEALWATGLPDGSIEAVDIPARLWSILELHPGRNTAVSNDTSHSFSGVRIFRGPKVDAETGIDALRLAQNNVVGREPGRPSNWGEKIVSIYKQRSTQGHAHERITAEAKEILRLIEQTTGTKPRVQPPSIITIKNHLRPFFKGQDRFKKPNK